jgi:hypothetical protein
MSTNDQPWTDWKNVVWTPNEDSVFPYFINDFPNMTFKEVYDNNKDYVEFMLRVRNPTGLYKAFVDYAKGRINSS